MAFLIAALASLPNAFAWAKYIRAVSEGRALEAAAWDVVIVALSNVLILTLWQQSDYDFWVLVGGACGGACGTYWTVRGGK